MGLIVLMPYKIGPIEVEFLSVGFLLKSGYVRVKVLIFPISAIDLDRDCL